jgi:hypothetical protein
MTVSIMTSCGPSLGASVSGSRRRVSAQSAAGARAPVSYAPVSRSKLSPPQAINRPGSSFNSSAYDNEAVEVDRCGQSIVWILLLQWLLQACCCMLLCCDW